MADEQERSLIHIVRGLMRVIGAVAGAVVGVGTLAFSAGFLAQRAQYDFVQVPFVFIDYWAYAETGLMALVRSINLFVGRPLCLTLLGVASVAIVLALESGRFRRTVLRPHWTFLGYLALIFWLGLVLRQEIAVRELRNGPIVQESVREDGSRVAETTTVPARFPFRLAVPEPVGPPDPAAIELPPNSVELWNRIADDLEREVPEGAVYLEVRPKPSWAVVLLDGWAGSDGTVTTVLGAVVDPDRLDAARAEELYGAVLSAFLVGVWAFVVLGLWQRRVYRELMAEAGGDDQGSGKTGPRSVLYRLREELWFSSKWILRGIAALLLIATGLFLMPECYGLLAMPRLGQEYVEVVSAGRSEDESTESPRGPRSALDVEREELKALKVLNDFTSSGGEEKVRQEWRLQIASLERTGSAEAAQVLKMMANASEAISTDLSDMARESLSRITFAATEGFILYYPRSETEYLRLLRRNPDSAAKRWTVYPVEMADIVEIRVKRDERTVQLIGILRRMSELDPQARLGALIEVEKLGHGRLLEVAIGGTFDPSHLVRGVSITDIGRYAAGLAADGDNDLRRQLAATRILEVLRDAGHRADHRATAATSLHRFVPTGEVPTCTTLVGMLGNERDEMVDDGWLVRGAVITSIGRLRCRSAVPRLLALLEDESVPAHVRGTIPTQLIRVGKQEDSADELGSLINRLETPAEVIGAALTALSLLEGSDTAVAMDSLERFAVAERYSEEVEQTGQVSYFRMAAVDSLRQLGNPRSVETLQLLADPDREQDVDVRTKAVIALGEFEDPRSESLLIDIAEDEGEPDQVRFWAIHSLKHYHDNRVARRVTELHASVNPTLQEAIVETLAYRGVSGSGYAATEAERLAKLHEVIELPAQLEADRRAGLDSRDEDAREPAPEIEPAPLGLRVGDEVQGFLDEGDRTLGDGSYFELVQFDGRRGQRVTVDLLSDDFDALLSVAGPGLEAPLFDDDGGGRCHARISLTLAETGSYLVGVNSSGGGPASGSFVVRVSESPPPPLPGPCSPPSTVAPEAR